MPLASSQNHQPSLLADAFGRNLPWEQDGLTRWERVVAFVEDLKITAGKLAGENIRLRDWQRRDLEPVYSTDEHGRRLVRRALLSYPRKQGKTALAAALALCHLAGPEAEPRGQVYSAASDRDQAAILFREMVAMIQAHAYLQERIIIRQFAKSLEDAVTGSTYQALSSDARKAHGLSPSFVVCDELAQWKSRELYDNLATGTGARHEPLMLVTSTQSPDPNHVMSQLVEYGTRLNSGEFQDPTFHAVIYSAPLDADPWDEETWHACNPALDDFRDLQEFRSSAELAKQMPANEPSFRLLYLNQPVETAARFLNRADWQACAVDEVPDLSGESCILALDLSSTTDLTSLAAFFPDHGALLSWSWMPAENVKEAERRDHVPYTRWIKDGHLLTTPGRAVDKRYVVQEMAKITDAYQVHKCVYDRWGIEEIKRAVDEEGLKIELEPWGQGYRDMSPALAAMETMVLQQTLKHYRHPVLDWAVSNAVVAMDPAGNRKLAKDKAAGRIDPLQAAVMAVGASVKGKVKKGSVYAERGIFTLDVSKSQ